MNMTRIKITKPDIKVPKYIKLLSMVMVYLYSRTSIRVLHIIYLNKLFLIINTTKRPAMTFAVTLFGIFTNQYCSQTCFERPVLVTMEVK